MSTSPSQMAADEVVPANSVLFEDLCVVLEQIYKVKKKQKNDRNRNKNIQKQELLKILENFINTLKIKIAAVQGKKNSTMFPVLRLLLPKHERERSPYNLKETKLGPLLVKVLSLSNQSPVAQKLLNFRSVSNAQDSDFAGVAYYALKGIVGKSNGTLTIGDINSILDKIATAETGNKGPVLDEAFSAAMKNLSPEQLKWFFRLILKDLKLGIESNLILAAFHPDAPEFFKTCTSLSKVCEELEEGDTRPLELGIKLFYAVSPMLSERLDVMDAERLLSCDKIYLVENKFDGERFQIHMENGIFEYFSRKGHTYSDNYGKTYDSGLLTPYLKDRFGPEVKSFILDGEMMGWHKAKQHFSSKGIAFDVKKITLKSVFRPCFCAFDLLYYNGRSLAGPPEKGGMPLRERLEILDTMFTDETGIIQHSVREYVTDIRSDVLTKLNEAMENQEEGIVVKDAQSYYMASRRNAGWYKVKPEYTEGAMEDLDLVIIGADEGQNKKQGRAKSFHVACVDIPEPGEAPRRWVSVGRVTTGFSDEERERVCMELQKHWHPTKSAPIPLELDFNKETPDFWVLPEHSTVLQVRATELVKSTGFGTSYTFRFPRVVKIRDDKPVRDVMTLDAFNQFVQSKDPVVKLNLSEVNKDMGGANKVRKKRPAKEVKVAEQFVTTTSEVEVVSKALLGRKICILSDDEDCKKPELRRIVESHSGTFVSNIGADTWCAVVGRITRRENEIIRSQDVDVTSTAWLRALPPLPAPCLLPPVDMLATKKATRLALCRDFDAFGDNYKDPVDEASLKKCFDKMDRCQTLFNLMIQDTPCRVTVMKNAIKEVIALIFDNRNANEPRTHRTTVEEPRVYLTKQEMLNLDRELFGECNPFSFLRPCLIHVAYNSSLLAIQARMFGAALCDLMTPNLTHVVVSKTTKAEDVASLKRNLNVLVVSEDWLKACFECKTVVPEDNFLL